MTISPREMDKLLWAWEFHRRDCTHQGDAKIEYASGGGIGTRLLLTCACGKEMDATDYHSW